MVNGPSRACDPFAHCWWHQTLCVTARNTYEVCWYRDQLQLLLDYKLTPNTVSPVRVSRSRDLSPSAVKHMQGFHSSSVVGRCGQRSISRTSFPASRYVSRNLEPVLLRRKMMGMLRATLVFAKPLFCATIALSRPHCWRMPHFCSNTLGPVFRHFDSLNAHSRLEAHLQVRTAASICVFRQGASSSDSAVDQEVSLHNIVSCVWQMAPRWLV